MYDQDDEILKLMGAMLVRPESPVLDIETGRAIERAFRELAQNKYLYQNQVVDLQPMFAPLQEAILKATEEAKMEAAKRSRPGGPPDPPLPKPMTPERFKQLCQEVSTRPWHLSTRHIGDTETEGQITRRTRGAIFGGIDSPLEEMFMPFLLPSVQLQCLGACKAEKTFSAHVKSCGNPYSQPWGHVKGVETEQLFFPIFRCEGCSKFAYTMLVKRKGLKLQLCGMTPRRPVTLKQKIPETVISILSDAEQAIAEGIYLPRSIISEL